MYQVKFQMKRTIKAASWILIWPSATHMSKKSVFIQYEKLKKGTTTWKNNLSKV